MNEWLELLGLEAEEYLDYKYNKYKEQLRSETNKLRMEWDSYSICSNYGISAMFK